MNIAERYGPWALITGASEGTGAAFAHKLADQGVNLILVARREGPLAELAEQIRTKGVECTTASVDLSTPGAAEKVIAAAGDREVGLLIANAGADTVGSAFLDKEIESWNQLIQLNVLTTVSVVHHFARGMRDRKRGGIILVGSGACYGGLNGLSVYAGSKAFLLCFGEALWAELRHHGVDVLNLILGRTDTPAHRRSLELSGQPIPAGMATAEEVAETGLARLPHGPDCNWGHADDVAGFGPNSPAERRARIIAIEEMSRAYTGKRANKP